jgi:hypothetical protein
MRKVPFLCHCAIVPARLPREEATIGRQPPYHWGASRSERGFAVHKDATLPLAGLQAGARLFGGVWIELALGFVLAGMIDVLVPATSISRWLGADKLTRACLRARLPEWSCPAAVSLLSARRQALRGWRIRRRAHRVPLRENVVEPGPHPDLRGTTHRLAMTLARFIPSVLMAPAFGYIGQWLYDLLKAR